MALEFFLFESVDAETDDGTFLYYKLALLAFGSGELKCCYPAHIFKTSDTGLNNW